MKLGSNPRGHGSELSRRRFLALAGGAATAGILSPFFTLANRRIDEIRRTAFTMGSIVTVTAYCRDEAACDHAIDSAFREMKTIDALMSVFDRKSEISRANHEAGKASIGVDPRVVEIVEYARRYSAITNGAFDITVEPLMELYGFRDDASQHRFPTDAEIALTLDALGMKNVSIDPRGSQLGLTHPGTELDLGGIAVGYALDRAARILRSNGVESSLINHSGDILAIGSPPEDDHWEVGITDPVDTEKIATTVRICDEALSTSGNYRNFVKAEGRTIGHILDPASGRSADSLLSATVIAPSAVEADALSTGLFVLGIANARPIVERHPALSLVAISRSESGKAIQRF
jgi:thiamine biosynthesis lipoprotein